MPALTIGDLCLVSLERVVVFGTKNKLLWPNRQLQAQAINLLFMESAAFQDVAGVLLANTFVQHCSISLWTTRY